MSVRYYFIILSLLLSACSHKKQKTAAGVAVEATAINGAKNDLMKELGVRYIFGDTIPTHAYRQDLDSLLESLAAGDRYIFTDLYPILDTLPALHNGYPFMLAGKLQDLGYTYVTAGSGNYEQGPRHIYILYEKDSIQCSVYQAYQYHELMVDSTYNMFVYEQIECICKQEDV